mgnify:CR=1 FL=1
MSERDQRLVKEINDIFTRGNSVEIKKDKDDNYIVYEVTIRNQHSYMDSPQMFANMAVDNNMAVVGQGEKQIKLAEIRAVLAEKAGAGHMAEVKALLRRRGVNKLSEINPAEYPALLADAEVL